MTDNESSEEKPGGVWHAAMEAAGQAVIDSANTRSTPGSPAPSVNPKPLLGCVAIGLGLSTLLFFGARSCSSGADSQALNAPTATTALSDTEALMYCKSLIESSAKWDYDWESFTGIPDDVTYSRATTADGDIEVTVRGSGLKLQNGFGAWARRNFSCSLMAKTKKVADLQIY